MPQVPRILIDTILNSLPVGLLVLGPRGEVLTANPALSDILGHPRDKIVQKGWAGLFLDDANNDELTQALLDVIQQRQVNHKRHVRYQTPRGEARCLEVVSSVLLGQAGGQAEGLVVIFQDNTLLEQAHANEKKALEENRRLAHLRVESLNRLAMSIAHQIRNPVMTIGGFTGLAQRHADDHHKTLGYLNMVMDAAKRLEAMADAVRDYAGIGPPQTRRVLVRDLVVSAMAVLEHTAAQHGSRICWDTKLADIELLVDAGQLRRALDAVLENALEASLEGVAPSFQNISQDASGNGGGVTADDPAIPITVSCDRKNGTVVLRIQDHGRGIAAPDLPHVCEPFFTTKAVGAGMGLSLAERILQEHQGRLGIASTPGQGTTVSLVLPDSWGATG